jgi:Flp pilus assembly pilin Flp
MNKKGLIKTIIVIVIALVILGYFGFNVGDIINSPTVQANLHTSWDFISKIWSNYLAGPVVYVWDHIIVGLLWPLIKSVLPAATSTPSVL